MKDLHSKVGVLSALSPALTTATTDTAGNAIDLQGFNSLAFVAQTGAVTTTNASINLRVQESDTATASDFSDVAPVDLTGSNPAFTAGVASIANAVRKVGYHGAKRYVRIVRTGAASATGNVGAIAVLGHPTNAPAA